MSSTVVWQDMGLERLNKNLLELKKLKVRVGYQEPEGKIKYSSGITVARLAAVIEFGSDETPARSFIRSTIHESRAAIGRVQREQVQRVITGERTPVEAMSAIGSFVVGLSRRKLDTASGWAAPLKAETAEAKGSPKVLEETGLLNRSLSWRVSSGRTEFARGSS
jgi:hypothetical protein